jgi:hypothetical protein
VQIFPEQFNDELAALALATRAAYLVAPAEDAVVLKRARSQDFLSQLHVTERRLDQQTGLFGANQETVETRQLKALQRVAPVVPRYEHMEARLGGIIVV